MTTWAMPTRFGRIVLGVIVLALIVLATFSWEPVWRWTMQLVDPPTVNGNPVRRIYQGKLKSSKGVSYYIESGMKAEEWEYRDGRLLRATMWDLDGKVLGQTRSIDDDGNSLVREEPKGRPPWWWGVKDQSEPSAPWWKRNG